MLLSSSLAFAQGVYWGPKAALNYSSLSHMSNSSGRLRGAVGVFAGYQLSKVAAVQAEVLYSWQGANADLGNADLKYSLNYLKIPVMAKVFLIGGLNVEAGLSFNMLTSARDVYGDKNEGMKGFNGFDLSIPVGLNILIVRHFEVGLRYDISLANAGTPLSHNAKNSNWQLSVGFRF